ncbi:MAG: DUF3553 domain-containing protein [Phycisphaerae bacterium]|jgi:hypothetical protein
MREVAIGPELVGMRVQSAARPDWGVGTVTRVERSSSAGEAVFRVSVQFNLGLKHLLVPPARLIAPQPEPTRRNGWLDSLGCNTLDDRLRRLPADALEVLGTPAQKLGTLAKLYRWSDDATAIAKWARAQTGVGDPLSVWTRDELEVAFRDFANERDAALRAAAARIKMSEGPEALRRVLDALPEETRPAVDAALSRIV